MTGLSKHYNSHDKYWAGGFLHDPATKSVFLHHRDSNTKFNPNKWAFFGGLNEGDETPNQCFVRELEEEIGLTVGEDQVLFLREYMNEDLNTYRIVFYVQSNISENKLTLGEGAGFAWVPLNKISNYDLTDKTQDDIEYFMRNGD
ncbi:MAG: NUDIX domain-containing protein [Candidatus Thiodiazotropha sp. (ex Dulcina madagascariensis)]|nr:NUDIX domain-containing protein [Candidatus Thiodiazotropha sp. (ex Dulcina madagascariensis)]